MQEAYGYELDGGCYNASPNRASITDTMQGADTHRLTQSVHTVGIWQRPGTQPSLGYSNDSDGNELFNSPVRYNSNNGVY